MLVLHKKENKIKLKPEIPEDLWHLEKIIKPGDMVSGRSTRKYTTESGSDRKHVFITMEVEKAEFHQGFEKLRILGVIKSGSPEEYVSLGSHHSLDIGIRDMVTIQKKKWMRYELDRIKEAQAAAKRPKISALIMDESEAELFSIKEYGIGSLGRMTSYGRGKYAEERIDLRNKYYTEIYDLLQRAKTEKIILAGPGFEAENFLKFMQNKNPELSKQMIFQRIGNTGKQGVYELVEKDVISKITKQSRFDEETKAIEGLVREISSPRPKATYGLGPVKEALEMGAVEKLLVLDSFLFEKRDKVEPLLERAEKFRSKIMIVSHENEISAKLEALGGIAALLRFQVDRD